MNVGGKRPRFTTNGIKTSMTFQCATGVKKPLAAASNITAKGNCIVLDDANSESYIENKATGVEIPVRLESGTYMLEFARDSSVPIRAAEAIRPICANEVAPPGGDRI